MIPLLLDFLSAYRLTRLITADTITAPLRDRLIADAYHRAGRCGEIGMDNWTEFAMDDENAPKLATLATCRFCAGVYVSFGVMVARRRFPRQWAPIAEALALSAGAALIAGLED